jgi:hypothetical protein
VDQLHLEDIISSDFSIYKLILVGYDTGSTSNWGDEAGAQAGSLQASGKPILGFGEGGYAFFGKLGLLIGWGNGAHGEGKDVKVISSDADYWNDPFDVSIPGSQVISLYGNPGNVIGIHLPDPVINVEQIANTSGDKDYYPLVRESERYFLWGYDGTPSAMTNKGARVLINIMEALIP